MPFSALTRPLFALLSWALLGVAVYLLWTGWVGVETVRTDGVVIQDRTEWRIALGAALLAWSFFGRLPTLWITTRPDRTPTRPVRENGRMVDGATGSRLYVEEDGDGRPVILLHGWGMDSTLWRRTRAALRLQCRLISWDLPGLGLSRLPAHGRPSLDLFAEDLRGLVAAQSSPVVLIGHSIGGMTIQTLAREHPELFGLRVAGVVLLNTTYTDPSRTMVLGGLVRALRPLVKLGLRLTALVQPLAWLSAWQSYLSGSAHLANRLGFGPEATRSELEHTTLLATRNPPGVQALGVLAMLDWDADGALSALGCPILVLGGDIDVVTKLEASAHIAATAPTATLVCVERANHMGFLDRADVYNGEIAGFIAALDHPAGETT